MSANEDTAAKLLEQTAQLRVEIVTTIEENVKTMQEAIVQLGLQLDGLKNRVPEWLLEEMREERRKLLGLCGGSIVPANNGDRYIEALQSVQTLLMKAERGPS